MQHAIRPAERDEENNSKGMTQTPLEEFEKAKQKEIWGDGGAGKQTERGKARCMPSTYNMSHQEKDLTIERPTAAAFKTPPRPQK